MSMTDTQSETEKAFVERIIIKMMASVRVGRIDDADASRLIALVRRAVALAPEPAAFDMAELRKLWDSHKRHLTGFGSVENVKAAHSLIAALHNAFPAIDAEMTQLRERVAELEEENGQLSDEVCELKIAPWPKWAEQCLKIVREHTGYDGYDDQDGVDLPEELAECLSEYEAQACAKTIMLRANAEADRHKSTAEHYRQQANQLRAEASADKAKGGKRPQPTIAELETILAGDDKPVRILPDGSVVDATPTPTGARVAGEDNALTVAERLDEEERNLTADNEDGPNITTGDIEAAFVRIRAALATAPDTAAAIRRKALLDAAKRVHRFQDIVGWQKGESRNELIGDIEEALRTLAGEPTP